MKIPLLILVVLSTAQALAQTDEARRKNFNIRNNIAISGYDPVSYFEGQPKEGEDDLRYSYKGVTYLFTSSSSLKKFKTNPEKFEPAYGGWCAFAMGESGEKVKVDPETYKILNGKL